MPNKKLIRNLNVSSDYLDKIKEIYKCYHTTNTDIELEKILNKYGLYSEHSRNNRQFISDIMFELYPNENVVKSAFINNVLFKSNNHTTIFELSVANSRTDLCKINGTSIAYEIKTQYDNFYRLYKQVNDYLSVFEYVYVICPKSNVEVIKKELPMECGIYSYTQRDSEYIFSVSKKGTKSTKLNSLSQLGVLTKKECSYYFKTEHSMCKEQIMHEISMNYTAKYINSIFKKSLKEKYFNNWSFLKKNNADIYNIDYQWFFKHNIDPAIIYC